MILIFEINSDSTEDLVWYSFIETNKAPESRSASLYFNYLWKNHEWASNVNQKYDWITLNDSNFEPAKKPMIYYHSYKK